MSSPKYMPVNNRIAIIFQIYFDFKSNATRKNYYYFRESFNKTTNTLHREVNCIFLRQANKKQRFFVAVVNLTFLIKVRDSLHEIVVTQKMY